MKQLYYVLVASTLLVLVSSYQNTKPDFFDYNITMKAKDPLTNQSRYFLLTLPKNNLPKKWAVVIVLHGATIDANEQALQDGFWKMFPQSNVAVAYGQSLSPQNYTVWDAGFCCSEPNNDIKDIKYIVEIIETVVMNHGIDEERIYMTGWSNGAMLTERAVCVIGDKIRAAAPYAGALLMKKLTMANSAGELVPQGTRLAAAMKKFGGITAYYFNSSVTEFDWFKFSPSYFTCSKGYNTPMLIMNGADDLAVTPGGYLQTMPNTDPPQIVYGIPPSKFTVWTYASLNEKETPTYSTPYSSFKKRVTLNRTVGNDTTICKQVLKPDGTELGKNITFCTGSGGHVWWGSEYNTNRTEAQLDQVSFFGPYNKAFNVSDEVFKFFCANGAECLSSISQLGYQNNAASYKYWMSQKIGGISVMIISILLGGIMFYRSMKNQPSEGEEEVVHDDNYKLIL